MSPISSSTPADSRHELAAALRALRLDAGRSTTEVADQLGWSQSKVSRVERGVTLAKPYEVDAWARLLHADLELRQRLVELAQQQSIELTAWKQAMAPGRRRRQQEIQALEAAARTIWLCPLDVVPGLAQTARYAEVMFRIGREPRPTEEEVAEAVRARLARQAALDDPAKRFKLLCTECALRRSLLSVEGMQEQLRRMADVSRRPTVELGVIPFSARERVHTYHGFSILGDPETADNALVLVETVTRRLTVRAPEEVREYVKHFDSLAESALYGDELRKLLSEVADQAPWA